MKWLGIIVLAALVGGGWFLFSKSDDRAKALQTQIEQLVDEGDPEERVPKIESEIQSIESQKTFNGILLAVSHGGSGGSVVRGFHFTEMGSGIDSVDV